MTFEILQASSFSTIKKDKTDPLIQIIDDDLTQLMELKRNLEDKGWLVIADANPQTAISHYFEMRPDCLILDNSLVNKLGYQFLEEIQKHNQKLFVPKIILSSDPSREARLKALSSGADDYFTKPLDIEEISIRIARHLELKQIFEQSVLIDELTQVFNKRFMELDLPKRLDDWRRSDYSLTIAVIDIDHFSTLNKRFDFLIGDRVLADLALFLQENIRSTDTVYRLGEDRFLLVFPRSTEQKASEVLNRLLKQYSQKTHEYHNQTFSITFSAGIFEVQHPDMSSKELVSFAEQALEKAKREGRARVEMFNDKTLITKKKLFISVIEHDSIIRTMLMKVLASLDLEQYEIQIELFEDGVKFVESDWIRLNGYHFIVFEAVMPLMNGIEILYKLKELKLRSPMRILMLAGKKDEKEIARALRLGADDYMTKPFSITEVKARIERLLQRML